MANEVREARDFRGAWDFQSAAEIVPERDALFGAEFHRTQSFIGPRKAPLR